VSNAELAYDRRFKRTEVHTQALTSLAFLQSARGILNSLLFVDAAFANSFVVSSALVYILGFMNVMGGAGG
jgi:hypothetical protein